ncbi:MAG: hypothetical protein AUI15_13205 [Actinobacteria bacterium 13_2_20CM_2_66_6]|nr:MAG: hypothetical protein AUI15_13205 [Actinobacteria bacterium 13_2_20CM_2_66_6]
MIIRGGTIVTARGVERADIVIADGRIVEVGANLDESGTEIDAKGLHAFPGGIDSHVHLNEPGRTEWEDIAHGTAALAAGGYTAFVDMPLNNLPVTTTVDAFDLKLAAMRRWAKIDYGLWGGLVPGNLDQLAPDSILLVHAEDPSQLGEPKGPTARDFIESRPWQAELSAIQDVITLSRETGCRLHIVHVSTVRGTAMIQDAQLRGIDVSGETCPHYLLYADDDLERLGGIGKCAPPFRSAGNRDDLMAMVAAGEVEIVVSDHSPSTLDLKQGDDFRKIWGGIACCQSTRQLLLAQANLDLNVIAAVTSSNISRRFRLPRKGDIAPGFDADLWIVDLGHDDVVRREDLLYRNRLTAHEGQRIRGRTIKTLVRGGEPGRGELIRPSARS